MADKQILSAIDQAVAALTAARKLLASGAKQATTNSQPKPSAKNLTSTPSAGKRGMSEEGRQRIAEAQRKRWAAKKKAAKKAARATS